MVKTPTKTDNTADEGLLIPSGQWVVDLVVVNGGSSIDKATLILPDWLYRNLEKVGPDTDTGDNDGDDAIQDVPESGNTSSGEGVSETPNEDSGADDRNMDSPESVDMSSEKGQSDTVNGERSTNEANLDSRNQWVPPLKKRR